MEAKPPPSPLTKEQIAELLRQHQGWLASDMLQPPPRCFVNAPLYGADLSGATLTDAVLDGANLNRSTLNGAELATISISTGAWAGDANGSPTENAEPSPRRSVRHRTSLAGTHLLSADLTDCHLQSANMRSAHLVHAKLNKATLSYTNLNDADLENANLTEATLSHADLTGANLRSAKCADADLRGVVGLRLDNTYVRGAQFSPVTARWWAFLCNFALRKLHRWCEVRDWKWCARQVQFPERHSDPWSVLRQLYAGPRLFFLLLFVIVFALPYVGRVAFYSAVGPVERRLAAQAESKKHELEARLAANPADHLARVELTQVSQVLAKVEPRPVWQVLLRWDEGKIGPTVLAVLLIFYNVGLYVLISRVSPLRDEEERSGWSPAWDDYKRLIWVHRVVTGLFYVSLISFIVNVSQLLTDVVFVVKPG